MFALSAKACCYSVGLGFKAALAAATAGYAAQTVTDSKGATAAAALMAAGVADRADDSQVDINFTEPCWSTDRGMCEVVGKLACCYTEVQFPPGKDIGCALCGTRCLDTNKHTTVLENAVGMGHAPEQERMVPPEE